jgi:uncharacterized membrane-anchored protein
MLLMTKRRKILTWLGLVLSLPAASYAGVSVIFYAWLNAAEPERWPSERAGLWSGVAAVLALLFLALFVYCLASLIGEANRRYREEQKQHGQ